MGGGSAAWAEKEGDEPMTDYSYPRVACSNPKCGKIYSRDAAGKVIGACPVKWRRQFRTRMNTGTWVRRGHKCRECGTRFITVELIPDVFGG